jgi:hypothetical protein
MDLRIDVLCQSLIQPRVWLFVFQGKREKVSMVCTVLNHFETVDLMRLWEEKN